MDQVHVVRHKVLNEGQSIRRVAREFGLSRNTVSKYLEQSEPVRRQGRPRRRPVWEAVQPRLEELLAEWEPRTTGKQRITAMRLYRQLRVEGYGVGRTLVDDYWRERRRQRAEVYVPLINRPGEAQIDSGSGGRWPTAQSLGVPAAADVQRCGDRAGGEGMLQYEVGWHCQRLKSWLIVCGG
jgi:transposase-like protein